MLDKVWGEWRIVDLIMVSIMPQCAVLIIKNLKTIRDSGLRDIHPDGVKGEALVWSSFLTQIFGYLLPIVLLFAVAAGGEKPMVSAKVTDGEMNGLFLIAVVQCCLMQHLTCHLQVCHVTATLYSPFENRINLFVIASSAVILAVQFGAPDVKVLPLITGQLLITLGCQWHYILCIMNEIAHALGIRVLLVKDRFNRVPT